MKEKKVKRHFSEEDILSIEPRLIDVYTKSDKKTKPFRLLMRFYKGFYPRLFFAFILYGIKSCPQWIMPLITADVINVVTSAPANAATRILIDFGLALLVLAQNIPTHMLYIKITSTATRSVEAGLRGAMIRKLQQLSIMFHKEMQSGKIQSKIMRDVEAVSDLSRTVFEEVVNAIFSMGMALIVIVTKNVWVFLMFVVCVPLAVIIRRLFAGKMRARTHAFRKEIEDTSSAVFDMEELIPISRAHALENKEIKKMTRKVTRVAETGFRFDFIQSFFGSLNWVTFFLFQTICLCFTGFLALRGVISVGEVAMYQTYFSMLTGIVSGLVALLPTISRGSESILSIGEILSAYDVEDNSNKLKIHELSGKYEFRDISFQYDERTDVLEHLNLTVNPGETIALVGESGSGKTTIINLVIGFYKAQHGQLLVDGHNIDDLDLHAYRRMISIVPQNSILFSGSIRDNIVYGKSHISEERLQEVIKMAQLESVIEKLPNGLDTLVGEHGDKLSGGQKQRISIARAIIREPKVIIFDEATSALDSVTEREIQTAIDNLTRDRTTFIVAHRLSTIKNADKIAVIADGECVEFGTYDELMAKKGAFYRYKEMQS